MPVKKGSVGGLVWIEFQEHPVVDYQKQIAEAFDVTSKGYEDFPSDFLKDGLFDHQQYCICLMETALRIHENEQSDFFNYQCSQLEDPHLWVVQFNTLLEKNANHHLIAPFKRRLNFLNFLLERRRNEHSGYVKKKDAIFKPALLLDQDERFNIVKVKEELNSKTTFDAKRKFLLRIRTDYLQEIENNKKALFVEAIKMELRFLEETRTVEGEHREEKKNIFRGTTSQLADLMGQLKQCKNKHGEFLIDSSMSTYVQTICDTYCQVDGSPFVKSSIRRGLLNFNNNKRPRKKDQIDISHLEIDEA